MQIAPPFGRSLALLAPAAMALAGFAQPAQAEWTGGDAQPTAPLACGDGSPAEVAAVAAEAVTQAGLCDETAVIGTL